MNGRTSSHTRRTLSRRRLLRGALLLTAAAAAPAAGVALARSRDLQTEHHEVPLPGLHPSLDGLRVVQLSDLHSGPLVGPETIAEAARAAAELRPDLAVLTGDFVSRSHTYIGPCIEALRVLRPPLGVYGVPGNHDHASGVAPIGARLAAARMPLLVNRNVEVERGLFLAGVDDLSWGDARPELALRGIPKGSARIMMCHNPRLLERLDEPLLLIAGHTHGGQINLGPLTGLLTSSITSRGRFVSGWYSRGDARLYVNRGIGVVGIPLRFRSRPEVTLFTLRCA